MDKEQMDKKDNEEFNDNGSLGLKGMKTNQVIRLCNKMCINYKKLPNHHSLKSSYLFFYIQLEHY